MVRHIRGAQAELDHGDATMLASSSAVFCAQRLTIGAGAPVRAPLCRRDARDKPTEPTGRTRSTANARAVDRKLDHRVASDGSHGPRLAMSRAVSGQRGGDRPTAPAA
jgi:hypothetical protein